MSQLSEEIDANFTSFSREWLTASSANISQLTKLELYKESYRRITSLQAIKLYIIERIYDNESAQFFFEAHNDALISHINASMGSWRSALQSLRSCIENVLCAVYYSSHPIELELWQLGKFRIGFAELIKYLENHPKLSKIDRKTSGIEMLTQEYATLSKAVHGSAVNFRMTHPTSTILLWNSEISRAAMWATRERKTLEAICLLIVALNTTSLQGSSQIPLREVLAYCITSAKRKELREKIHVNIPDP